MPLGLFCVPAALFGLGLFTASLGFCLLAAAPLGLRLLPAALLNLLLGGGHVGVGQHVVVFLGGEGVVNLRGLPQPGVGDLVGLGGLDGQGRFQGRTLDSAPNQGAVLDVLQVAQRGGEVGATGRGKAAHLFAVEVDPDGVLGLSGTQLLGAAA